MSDRVKEITPFVSPDSLRKFLGMYKSFYNLHTDRNYGLDDSGGLTYAGTVENFGPEMLFESNKLRINKPPIGSLNISDVMKFYFDIKFVEDVFNNTDGYMYWGFDDYSSASFYKQNMVCGLLKKNSIINGYTYRILLANVQRVFYLGSESTSDSNVRRMCCYYTTTVPQLEITDPEGNVETKDLYVGDGSLISTMYYVPVNAMTSDLLDDEAIEDIDNGNLVINITKHLHYDIPYVWFGVERFRKIPNFTLTHNQDKFNMPLLYIGKDGHNMMHLYPSCGYPNAFPIESEPVEGCTCYLKAYGDFSYNDMSGVSHENISGEITKIELLYADSVDTAEPVERVTMECSSVDFTIRLNTNINWTIKRPRPGEYDYNYNYDENKPYAWVNLSLFDINNTEDIDSMEKTLLHAFNVVCDNRKFIETYEREMNHWVSGVHVDYTTDYSENGVDKIRGVTRDLGKYDGLPRYFNEWLSRETHRAHIETYSIRDSIINNADIYKRQTSSLIIDSGVPQKDMDDMGDYLNIVIEYQSGGEFDTTGESISSTNFLSDLGYANSNMFAYTGTSGYRTLLKFIYHKNGIFSLGVMGFDPELEYARVYSVTNDSIDYENNARLLKPKPERSIARICDIPQSYIQLVNTVNYAPTYALDQEYVRQGASWKIADEDNLWNGQSKLVKYQERFLFGYDEDLNEILDDTYLMEHYAEYGNFGRTIDMSHPEPEGDVEFLPYPERDPENPTDLRGHDYEVGDEFITLIGPHAFRGYVYSVSDENHAVTQIVMYENNNTEVNIANIPGVESYWKTTTVTGNGDGLVLLLKIDEDVWDNAQIKKIGILDGLYTFKYDSLGRIWIWEYIDGTWVQSELFIGEEIPDNYYDENTLEPYRRSMRSLKDVLLFNMFNSQINRYDLTLNIRNELLENAVDSTVDITDDISSDLSHYNMDETLYIPYDSDNPNHDIMEYHFNNAKNEWNYDYDRKLFPRYNDENTFYAYTPVNKITVLDVYNPIPYIYDPLLQTKSTYTDIMTEVCYVNSTSPRMFSDVIDSKFIEHDLLKYNVYEYSYRNDLESLDAYRETLSTKSRTELLEIISNMNEEADPITVEGTTNQYSYEQLIDYIVERTLFRRNGIQLMRSKGDSVTVGKQPVGGYVKLQTTHNPTVKLPSGSQLNSVPMYFFKLDASIEDLTNFRMYDGNGNDISEYTAILINNQLYMMYRGEWKRVKTKNQ